MAANDSDTSHNSLAADLGGVGLSNLYGVVDRDNIHGLNLTVPEDAKEVVKPWDQREDNVKYLDSSVDDQLIVHIPFIENVRIKSILLKLEGTVAPRHLQIYANRSTIVDFAEAEATRAHLNISLLEGETGVVEYPMRAATFASVHSLSLFFNDSVGGEVSRVYYIGFKGDMRSIKREVNSKLEVPAPHAADASLTDRISERAAGQQTTAR